MVWRNVQRTNVSNIAHFIPPIVSMWEEIACQALTFERWPKKAGPQWCRMSVPILNSVHVLWRFTFSYYSNGRFVLCSHRSKWHALMFPHGIMRVSNGTQEIVAHFIPPIAGLQWCRMSVPILKSVHVLWNVSFCVVTAVSDMLCGQVLLRFQMPSRWHWSAGARKKSAVMPHVSA